MGLRDTLDEISTRTETAVDGLYARRRAGQVDEERFSKAAAFKIDQANAQAAANAIRSVAAQKAADHGILVRPAGARPLSDRERLQSAVKTTATSKDGAPEDPETRRQRLLRLARSEPYSTAQDAMPKAMAAQGARGWVRVPNAKACKLCRHWADGKVRPVSMTMLRHPGCTCLQRPVFRGKPAAGPANQLAVGAQFAAERAAHRVAGTAAKRAVLATIGSSAAAGYVYRRGRPVAEGPTIFERMKELENHFRPLGIELVKGQYMVHGSGLLDALNIRQAGDLDMVAHPDLYDRIAQAPGWRTLQAGVNKDVEILSNPTLNVQVVKALDETPLWRRQITIADLETNTVTLGGREFIRPDLLAEMKKAAIREGAKVPKNIRDVQLLQGRLIWREDVERFGSLLNRSRLTVREERAVAAARHPAARLSPAQAARRAAAAMRIEGAKRTLRPIASIGERRALQRYGRGSFELNGRLRSGTVLSGYETELVRLIDQALAKQFTPFRVKTYRGLRMSRDEALALYTDKVGTVTSEASFTSTGLRESVARKYSQSGVLLELDVPAGTNGYYAPYRALTSQNLPNKVIQQFGEDELLLPRNLPYRVLSIEERPDGTVLIRAEVVPVATP